MDCPANTWIPPPPAVGSPSTAGTQYRSGIYWHTEAQREAAAARIQEVNAKLARGEKVLLPLRLLPL
jgi:peptide methionine sulfoxide reductase MsrA